MGLWFGHVSVRFNVALLVSDWRFTLLQRLLRLFLARYERTQNPRALGPGSRRELPRRVWRGVRLESKRTVGIHQIEKVFPVKIHQIEKVFIKENRRNSRDWFFFSLVLSDWIFREEKNLRPKVPIDIMDSAKNSFFFQYVHVNRNHIYIIFV